MTAAIRVDGLGKRYRLARGQQRSGYRTLRESLMDLAAAPFRRRAVVDEFWALKDVTFEVQPGEVVGVIGRNGAGKSTLLKVLSRITRPTEGWVQLDGRVGTLLEVGTGFHPELTGRENVFLNGSILGMSRREVAAKFDEIVGFAEVERFLDTPVKRYSSGQYVRLAFAVAAHLEPEILIVDEVLAVGDATFQKRCLDRMSQLARSGRTVLFVSHNMDLIPRLCRTAVLLERGRVKAVGAAAAITTRYLAELTADAGGDLSGKPRSGSGRARFERLELVGGGEHVSGDDLTFRMTVRADHDLRNVGLAVVVQNLFGTRILTSWNREAGAEVHLPRGVHQVECRFRNANLRPGHRLQVSLWLECGEVVDAVDHALVFGVAPSAATERFSTDPAQGVMLCPHDWAVRPAHPQEAAA
jgi:lipopolysaccharide transport system ATP-binding protein